MECEDSTKKQDDVSTSEDVVESSSSYPSMDDDDEIEQEQASMVEIVNKELTEAESFADLAAAAVESSVAMASANIFEPPPIVFTSGYDRSKSKRKYGMQDVPCRMPVFTKNDIVAFLDEGRVALAKVVKTQSNAERLYMRSAIGRDVVMGKNIPIHTIPDDQQDELANGKLLVLDRSVRIGDNVAWAKNAHLSMGNNSWNEKGWQQTTKGPIGMIMDYKVTGDLLLLPDKRRVLRNVDLLKCIPTNMAVTKGKKTLDRFGYSGNVNPRESTLIVHDGWIGEVTQQTDRVWLEYECDETMFTIDFLHNPESQHTILLSHVDGSSDKKRLVAGERVEVRLRELLCAAATWAPIAAPGKLHDLTRGIKGRKLTVICTVKKVQPDVLSVQWKRPTDTNLKSKTRPPVELRGERSKNIEIVHRKRLVRAGDRLMVPRTIYENASECEWEQYEELAHNTYKDIIPKEPSPKLRYEPPSEDLGLPPGSSTPTLPFDMHAFLEGETEYHFADFVDFDTGLMKVAPPEKVATPIKKLARQRRYSDTKRDEGDSDLGPLFEPLLEIPVLGNEKNLPFRCPENNDEIVVGEVLNTRSVVSVQWIDGSVSENVEGRLIVPVYERDMGIHPTMIGISALFPGNVVQRKVYCQKKVRGFGYWGTERHVQPKQTDGEFGVVLSVDDEERLVRVQWLYTKDNAIEVRDVEDCTLFDIASTASDNKLSPGRLGMLQRLRSNNLLENSFVLGKLVPDGRREVRFLSDNHIETIWPIEIKSLTPIVGSSYHLGQVGVWDGHWASLDMMPGITFSQGGTISADTALLAQLKKKKISDKVEILKDAIEQQINEQEDLAKQTAEDSSSSSSFMESVDKENKLMALIMKEEEAQAQMEIDSQPVISKEQHEELKALIMQYPSSSTATPPPANSSLFKIKINDKGDASSSPPVNLLADQDVNSDLKMAMAIKTEQALDGDLENMSETDSYDDMKYADVIKSSLMNGGSIHSSSKRENELVEDIAVLTAAARINNPEDVMANEAKKIAQKWVGKTSTSSTVVDAMSRLVKLVHSGLVRKEEIGLKKLMEKMSSLEESLGGNDKEKDDLLTDLGKIVNCRNAERVLSSIARLIGILPPLPSSAEQSNKSTQDTAMELDESQPRSSRSLRSPEERSVHGSSSSPVQQGPTKCFTMVSSCPNHKWLTDSSMGGSDFLRAVRREHAMLADLPEGIYVRAYEDRLDLLNAIIVGPRGTPFDTTPYFFEIKLPEEYPNKPPKVNFSAYSAEALNPNLYQEGKVCLSLLGTWSGKQSEKWNPKVSNLQQVLISIQALILNAEPYWNEPGREHTKNEPTQITASQRYNESTTINSIQYMERIFLSPPQSFEHLIRDIVKERLPGYRLRVESWFLEGEAPPEYPLPRLSKGFHLALRNGLDNVQKAVNDDIIRLSNLERQGSSNP